jgi:hypothetical protein
VEPPFLTGPILETLLRQKGLSDSEQKSIRSAIREFHED